MKKLIFLTLLLAAGAFLSAAEAPLARYSVENDSGFNKPYGAAWWLHRAQSAKGSKVVIVREGENKYLKAEIPAGKRNANIVCDIPFLPLKGGTLQITAKAKGKGMLSFNFYTYEKSGKYVGIYGTGKSHTIASDKWQECKDSFSFAKLPAKVGQLRLVLIAGNSSKIAIDDVKLVAVKGNK